MQIRSKIFNKVFSFLDLDSVYTLHVYFYEGSQLLLIGPADLFILKHFFLKLQVFKGRHAFLSFVWTYNDEQIYFKMLLAIAVYNRCTTCQSSQRSSGFKLSTPKKMFRQREYFSARHKLWLSSVLSKKK